MSRRRVTLGLAALLTLGSALWVLLAPDPDPPPLSPTEAAWIDTATRSLGLPPEASGEIRPHLGPALLRAACCR
ncbi:MAG: hypothetical protein AAFQ43_07580 [Bacteroidota bacterium]